MRYFARLNTDACDDALLWLENLCDANHVSICGNDKYEDYGAHSDIVRVYHDVIDDAKDGNLDNVTYKLNVGNHVGIDVCYHAFHNDNYGVLELLNDTESKQWEYREIYGSIQGEWNYMFYPKDTPIEQLNIISDLYFGMYEHYDIVDEDGEFYTSVIIPSSASRYTDEAILKYLSDEIGEEVVKIQERKYIVVWE